MISRQIQIQPQFIWQSPLSGGMLSLCSYLGRRDSHEPTKQPFSEEDEGF